jgi:serine/threonine protein kinase
MQELIGQRLGQYQIVEIIGQGGMALVFKARQPGLERWVAIKVLPPHYAADPHFSAHFLREAQAIAQLEHPHILPVYDFGQQGQYIYLVMRYIEGSRTLADVMSQPILFSQALQYLDQVAAALDYAHERGIAHRDIKPTNILLSGNWVFLADFGLARLTQTSAALMITDVALGTPAYMSPEQSRGAGVDSRTDIYALGVIIYQMLAGEIPHLAESTQAVLYRRGSEPPPLLQRVRPDMPLLMDQIVQTALALDPADRFQSAGALLKALHHAVAETQAGQLMTVPVHLAPAVSPPADPINVSPPQAGAASASPAAAAGNLLRLVWLMAGLAAVGLIILVVGGTVWLLNAQSAGSEVQSGTSEPTLSLLTTATIPPVPMTPTPSELLTVTPTAPAQTCSGSAGGPFGELWPVYQAQLGCPVEEARTFSTIAEEAFEGGTLFWIENTDQVYIIFDRQKGGGELAEGQWQLVPPEWKWDGSNPDGVGLSPPPGRVEPRRGFGWLWRTHLNGAAGPLGWALDREYGFDNVGQAQRFERGVMFKGSTARIYILLDNGQFYVR